MRFGRASTERDERENTDDSALASSSSSSAPLREIDGFRFIRSLATARISTADDYERARDRAVVRRRARARRARQRAERGSVALRL